MSLNRRTHGQNKGENTSHMKKKYQTDLSIYMQMRYDPQFDQLKEKTKYSQLRYQPLCTFP